MRRGLFGAIRVEWKAGYPLQSAPPALKLGAISPSSGKTHDNISNRLTDYLKPLFQRILGKVIFEQLKVC